MLERILENFNDEEILLADGFDDAVIGYEPNSMVLIYSVSKCLDILMKDMNSEEAHEHFDYNVAGAYVGKKTPIWCWDVV